MICVHLKKLYQLCESEGLKISSSDLVHIVCEQCGVKEVCPSMMSDEYDAEQKLHAAKETACENVRTK